MRQASGLRGDLRREQPRELHLDAELAHQACGRHRCSPTTAGAAFASAPSDAAAMRDVEAFGGLSLSELHSTHTSHHSCIWSLGIAIRGDVEAGVRGSVGEADVPCVAWMRGVRG